MSKKKFVAIVGANGYLGTNLRRFLIKKNISLISIARKNFNAAKSEQKLIVSNYSDKKFTDNIKKCSILVHLIGNGRPTIQSDYHEVNVKVTEKIVESCTKAGVKKIIYLSGLGVTRNTTSDYLISKLKAEKKILDSKLVYVIFRPSYIMGNGDPLTKSIQKQMKKGSIIIPGKGDYKLQPIHVCDVMKILYQSVTSKKYDNKILDLVGPSIEEYDSFVRKLHNKKTKLKKISLDGAYYNALHKKDWVFGVDDLNLLVGSFTGDFDRLQRISKIDFKKF